MSPRASRFLLCSRGDVFVSECRQARQDRRSSVQFAERRRSSVVEQPPCKRQVVCSIQTGGTKKSTSCRRLPALAGAILQRCCNTPLAALDVTHHHGDVAAFVPRNAPRYRISDCVYTRLLSGGDERGESGL